MRSISIILLLTNGCGGLAFSPLSEAPGHKEGRSSLPTLVSAGGDREILRGFDSYLDGRATTHPHSSSFSVWWEQIEGEEVFLSNTEAIMPTFIAPLNEGRLTFVLTADDGRFVTHDEVTLHVKAVPQLMAPRVHAPEDRFLDINEDVSDVLAALSQEISWEPLPTYATPAPVVFRLETEKDGLRSAPDFLVLHPFDADHTGSRAPTADLQGDQLIEPNSAILLDASKSTDPNGDLIRFRWEQTRGDPLLPVDPIGDELRMTAPARPQELSFRVFARDSLLESAGTELGIVVGAGMAIPTAHPGDDQRTRPGREVLLDALAALTNRELPTAERFTWQQTYGAHVELMLEGAGRYAILEAPPEPDELAFAITPHVEGIDGPPAVTVVQVVGADDNLVPVIYLLASTTEPAAEQQVSISAVVADPERDAIIACEWRSPSAIDLLPTTACDLTYTDETEIYFHAPASGETVTVQLSVVDEMGGETTESVEITTR